jgi:hypothetical protein
VLRLGQHDALNRAWRNLERDENRINRSPATVVCYSPVQGTVRRNFRLGFLVIVRRHNRLVLPMLSEGARNYLRPLAFNPSAERQSCIIPMGGIYWSDEIPDFQALLDVPESDRNQVYRLFAIRFKLWAGEELSDADQFFWNAAQQAVPEYPVFHRIRISEEDRAAQAAVEQETIAGFETLFSGADEVMVNDDGSFSATIDLARDTSLSWWQRFVRWLYRR